MSLAEVLDPLEEASPFPGGESVALGALGRGACGTVAHVGAGPEHAELERRLLELGFVEGARVRILHEGLLGRDPIAILLDERRVALRRREAQLVFVRLDRAR